MVGPLVAEKSLDDLLSDSGLWFELEQIAIAAVEPLFTELYLGGVLAGMIIMRRMGVAQKAEEDEEAFLNIVADPAFSARTAMIIGAYSNEWWQALNRTTRKELLSAIIEAREEGMSVRDLKKKIEPLFGRARAERIAVTETTRLFGKGAQASYQTAGVEMWNWHNAEDGRVCPDCDQRSSGGPYPMSMEFVPAHVSCRCWPVPFIERKG